MCEMMAFFYKDEANDIEIILGDLTSHSATQEMNPTCTENRGWYEGHYTPGGKVELRTPGGRNTTAEKWLLEKYPTFGDFVWALFLKGTLPYSKDSAIIQVLQENGVMQ